MKLPAGILAYSINPIFIFYLVTGAPAEADAQCSSSLKSISYQTVLNGTGNNSWGFLLPQFNPSLGTLISVNLASVVSVGFSFSLENIASTPASFSIAIKHLDSISSPDLSGSLTNTNTWNFSPYDLAASDGIAGSGPDYTAQGPFALMGNHMIGDSITGLVAPFIGTGYALFDYDPATTAVVSGNNDYSFSGTAVDTMHFTLNYYYCNATILSASLSDFMAENEKDTYIRLSWLTHAELPDRIYNVQTSHDGIHFDSVTSLLSQPRLASYTYNYALPAGEMDRIYFRLKITDQTQDIRYSEIRVVDLNGMQSGMLLYPNPCVSAVNIVFIQLARNWQVEICTLDGALVQKNIFFHSASARIAFLTKPAPGVYFVRASDTQSQENHTALLVIH
jgi:hypothetical protein